MSVSIKVGADPELFAQRKNGALVSVIGKFPGNKWEPHEIKGVGALQVDNVACEFNTIPAKSEEKFSRAVALPLEKVQEYLALKKLHISTNAFAEFPEKELKDPLALVSGCDPDFNAYTGETNTPPDFYSTNTRSAAGHVHVGTKLRKGDIEKLVKALDLTLTIPALKFENADRRSLYGKAGCFRPKSYGVEYRTPSNFWIFTDERRKWVFRCVQKAVEIFQDAVIPEDLEDVINNNNLQRAEELTNFYGLEPCPE